MVFRGFGDPTPEEEQRAIRTNTVKTPERALRFWDVASGTVRSSLPTALNYPLQVAFIHNEICAVATPSGVQFWNTLSSKLLAELTILDVRHAKGKVVMEWLVKTPDGRFDASQGAGPFLRWRVNGAMQEAAPAGTTQVPGLLGQVLDLDRAQI